MFDFEKHLAELEILGVHVVEDAVIEQAIAIAIVHHSVEDILPGPAISPDFSGKIGIRKPRFHNLLKRLPEIPVGFPGDIEPPAIDPGNVDPIGRDLKQVVPHLGIFGV